MSNNVHSRQPFDNRTEEQYRSQSQSYRDRSRDDRDYREQPRKNFGELGRRDRDREPDDRRDYRSRRDEDSLPSRTPSKTPSRRHEMEGVGLAASSPPEDVLREDESIRSSSARKRSQARDPSRQTDQSRDTPQSRDTMKVIGNEVYNSDRKKSLFMYGEFDTDKWIKLAEMGELDVYTCLGLSDACTWTVDTQSLILKIITTLVLQCLIPICMLYLVIESAKKNTATMTGQGIDDVSIWSVDHLKPIKAGIQFRGIGFVMFLYSLYSMYNAALDECRSVLLHFSLQERVACGIWWPLLLGEVANLLVAIILMCTLYFMFVQTSDGAYLVLNAVAVTFLADVDHQFVDRDNYMDATENFKTIMRRYEGKHPVGEACWSKAIEVLLSLAMMVFIVLGVALGIAFLFAPCQTGVPWYGEVD